MKRALIRKTTLFCILMGSIAAHASETSVKVGGGSSSESAKDVIGIKKYEENNEITDAKLKADAGSLSAISMRASLNYYGPPTTNFSALYQPNPDGIVTANQTAISGSVGLRYRLDSSTSLSLYAGVSDLFPFRAEQTLDVNSPSISYDKTFRLGGVQFLSSPSVSLVTSQVYKSKGESVAAIWYLNAVYKLGKTGFALGADTNYGYFFFNRDYMASDKLVRRFNIALSPYVKYDFTDRLNVNTGIGMNLYNLRLNDNYLDLGSRTISQKLGVGYAVTRDVYVAPYLMFYPQAVSLDTTTINMATSFSVL